MDVKSVGGCKGQFMELMEKKDPQGLLNTEVDTTSVLGY